VGGEITRILEDVRLRAPGAEEALLESVYGELRSLARAQMRRERPDHTLQPTALVHEAYVRLLGGREVDFNDRAHFFGAAAKVMRRILVDFARARGSTKRGGGRARVTWNDSTPSWAPSPDEILAVHECLDRLEAVDRQMSRIVELRFFSGLTAEESAAAMGISVRSGYVLWEHARAWLFREMGP